MSVDGNAATGSTITIPRRVDLRINRHNFTCEVESNSLAQVQYTWSMNGTIESWEKDRILKLLTHGHPDLYQMTYQCTANITIGNTDLGECMPYLASMLHHAHDYLSHAHAVHLTIFQNYSQCLLEK